MCNVCGIIPELCNMFVIQFRFQFAKFLILMLVCSQKFLDKRCTHVRECMRMS